MNRQNDLRGEAERTADTRDESVVVGIDWADQTHVVCLIDAHGRSEIAPLEQSPEAIDEWVAELQRRFPGRTFAVAVEQSKGALIHALMKYETIVLYPINPKQLSRYRDALHPSGGKDDPGDAELLARFLLLHASKLRPWKPDTEETRKLGRYVEIRRKLVEERKRLTLQLDSALKQYFPLLMLLFPSKLAALLALLDRWPSLGELQRAHPRTLRAFLKEQGIRDADRQTQLIETIRAAAPLTRDPAIVEPSAVYAQTLARQLGELVQSIEQFDQRIAELTARHPDQEIFRSLPGAGDALVPRMIAAFGSDRERYDSAEEIQCHSGIAPVTRRSGKTEHVSRRHACPKFLRQTFHEFADHARKWSAWSKAYYEHKRAAGCRHHAAVRALAFKWLRIIFRLWKTRTTYDEAAYIRQLQTRNSPLAQMLENA